MAGSQPGPAQLCGHGSEYVGSMDTRRASLIPLWTSNVDIRYCVGERVYSFLLVVYDSPQDYSSVGESPSQYP